MQVIIMMIILTPSGQQQSHAQYYTACDATAICAVNVEVGAPHLHIALLICASAYCCSSLRSNSAVPSPQMLKIR